MATAEQGFRRGQCRLSMSKNTTENTRKPIMRRQKRHVRTGLMMTALVASGSLLLAGCGGDSVGAGSDEAGFDFEASQEEIDQVLADLDPVTLVYQANATSPSSVVGQAGVMVKEAIEERSGGKISVDIVWGQAIASYGELDDALVDGRIDLAWHHPIYFPSDYPAYNELSTVMSLLPTSPYQGEIVTNAVIADVAYNTPAVTEEMEAKGLVPLVPMASSGSYNTLCTSPGNEPQDWSGRSVRAASQALETLVRDIGASPVSLQYPETYDALQRNVIDCTLGVLAGAAESTFPAVAPHLSYTTGDVNFPTRAVGAHLAGPSFTNLPLAYQQIVFDAIVEMYAGNATAITEGTAEGVRQVREAGGEIEEFAPETEQLIIDSSAQLREDATNSGVLDDEVLERIEESTAKWQARAEEMGIEDGGSFDTLDEWYVHDPDAIVEFGEQVFEEVFLERRPS
ncbi:MAG: TRAP transporter substrate-binding protein DctP [Micrococcaceae bacterium]